MTKYNPAEFSSEAREQIDYAANNCACSYLRKSARAVTRRFDELLEPIGIRSTQLVILVELGHRGPLSLIDLSAAMVMEKSSLSRTLKPLRARGLVAMLPIRGSRQKTVVLTADGAACLGQAIPLWIDAHRAFTEIVGESEWQVMKPNLEKIAAIADEGY